MPILRYVVDDEVHTLELGTTPATIGRGGSCAVTIKDNLSSRQHCQVRRSTEGYEVVDLESRNGTRLNGVSITQSPLKHGDVITIGHAQITYVEREEGAAAEPTDTVEAVPAERAAATAEAEEPEPPELPRHRGPHVEKALTPDEQMALVQELRDGRDAIIGELRKVIIGQEHVVEEVLLALLARGHCLLVGVPGLAKTLLVSSLASVLDLRFRRIQFTPDLMPSDITGTRVIEEDQASGKREFRFVHGPVFANILLADEINRTPPKTQAALLEAMQEKRVTVGGVTYDLDLPFLVLATQNPIEQEGTYPLPEAQLDRFMFSILLDYPKDDEEVEIYKSTTGGAPPNLDIVLSEERLLQFQNIVLRVPVSDYVARYVQEIVRTTRVTHPDTPDFIKNYVSWGAGPRAGQFIILGAKARAICHGRLNVLVEDVQDVAPSVLRHRIFVNFNAQADGVDSDEIVKRILAHVKPPE